MRLTAWGPRPRFLRYLHTRPARIMCQPFRSTCRRRSVRIINTSRSMTYRSYRRLPPTRLEFVLILKNRPCCLDLVQLLTNESFKLQIIMAAPLNEVGTAYNHFLSWCCKSYSLDFCDSPNKHCNFCSGFSVALRLN